MVVTINSFQAQMPKYRANALQLWQQLLAWLKLVFNVEVWVRVRVRVRVRARMRVRVRVRVRDRDMSQGSNPSLAD